MLARCSLLASLACLSGLGCASDETVAVPNAEGRDPACMVLVNTEGHWDWGGSNVIFDLYGTGTAGGACMCLTEDEFESEEIRWQLAEQVLADCERISATFDFAWDECEEDFENGVWLPYVYWAPEGSTFDFLVPPNLGCR